MIQLNHLPFVYTQFNGQIDLFQAIQFSISHLFALSLNGKVHSLNVKHFDSEIGPYQVQPVRVRVEL